MRLALHVEGSLCMHSGAAGWGAVIVEDGLNAGVHGGYLPGHHQGSTTVMELRATEKALQRTLCARPGAEVEIVLRTTAALAVLRWVFAGAPFAGDVEVHAPKRLTRSLKELECLYDMHDLTERAKTRVSLRHVSASPFSDVASERARQEMRRARGGRAA